MMPKVGEIEIPLLKCLADMGGRGKPQEIYPRMKSFFPDLTQAELAALLEWGEQVEKSHPMGSAKTELEGRNK